MSPQPENGPTLGPALAVVFDLDGLMFDTEALFHRVAGVVLGRRGKLFTHEMMQAMIGRRAAEAIPALLKLAGLDESPEELLTETKALFHEEMDSAVHPTPGLFHLLEILDRRGLPLAVATSSGRSYAERLLGGHGLLGRFSEVLTAEDVTQGKPNPEIYRKASARLGVDPSVMMVLEDSPAGVTAARAAGAIAVAVPHEHSPAQGLSHADLIVPRLDDPRVILLLGDRTTPT